MYLNKLHCYFWFIFIWRTVVLSWAT